MKRSTIFIPSLLSMLALSNISTAGEETAPTTAPTNEAPQVSGTGAENIQSEIKPNTVIVTEMSPEKLKEKRSYSYGVVIGKQLSGDLKDIDFDKLVEGIKTSYTTTEPELSKKFDEAVTVLQDHQKELMEKRRLEFEKSMQENKAKGEAFLKENGKKPGVKTTKSGLQYKVIKAGTGATPKATDTVEVNYKGTLIDGTEFDSSAKTGKPVKFGVQHVISGWTEALQLMKEGDKWEIYVPSNLAYREGGIPGGKIGPNETLIFEVELVKVHPKETPKPVKPKAEKPKEEAKETAAPAPSTTEPGTSSEAAPQ